MNKVNITLSEAGSLLLGAGLLKLTDDLYPGLIVVGVGVIIKIAVAILKKKGVVDGSRTF